jgi:hypothetical protein
MGQLVELLVRLQDTRSSSAFVTMLLQVRGSKAVVQSKAALIDHKRQGCPSTEN